VRKARLGVPSPKIMLESCGGDAMSLTDIMHFL
jgi:hypothetical protein